MAASANWRRFPNRPGAALTIKIVRAAPVTRVSWIFAPDRSVNAVRDPLAELGRRRYSSPRLRRTGGRALSGSARPGTARPPAGRPRTTSGGSFDVLTAAVGAE